MARMATTLPLGRRLRGVRAASCAILTGAICLICVPLVIAGEPEPMARSGVEMQFFDTRIPADERAVLDTIHGYALPAPGPGAEWVGGEAVDFAALRGQVIVVQSFTRADADGRGAMRRIESLVENLGLEGVRVIGVHTPEGADEAASFFAKRAPKSPTILDRTGAFCDELGVYKTPVTILVDRKGRIRYAGVAMAKLRPALELLAAEKIDASLPGPAVLPLRSARLNEPAPGAAPAAPAKPKAAFPSTKGQIGQARDLRGKRGPSLDKVQFLTAAPELENRVVMVEFWATWCPPCLAGIPHLNDLQREFKDSLTIIGLSRESEADVRALSGAPKMEYAIALDTTTEVHRAVSINPIPYAIVMSPDGIVRWQGHPASLNAATMQQIVDASGLGVAAPPAGPKRWVVTAPE
jgi:thiol-disulfide isomerase/thioredoxin